jgi:hypothetical protein
MFPTVIVAIHYNSGRDGPPPIKRNAHRLPAQYQDLHTRASIRPIYILLVSLGLSALVIDNTDFQRPRFIEVKAHGWPIKVKL